jgi:hypothetical protein
MKTRSATCGAVSFINSAKSTKCRRIVKVEGKAPAPSSAPIWLETAHAQERHPRSNSLIVVAARTRI